MNMNINLLKQRPIMKRNILRILQAAVVFLFLLMAGYSCSSNDTLTELEARRMIENALLENNKKLEKKFTQWEIVHIPVEKSDWQWIADRGHFEAIFDLPELDEFIYENGAVLAYLFIGEQGVDEVQNALPYVRTYPAEDDQGNLVTFTETISYGVMFKAGGKSNIAFYIQASDLLEDPEAPNMYNFRVVLIW